METPKKNDEKDQGNQGSQGSQRKNDGPTENSIAGAGEDAKAAPRATGRVFVRFEEGVLAQDRAAALADAGWEIDRVPPWAPHAAWLRPRGRLAGAPEIAALERLPDMASVEPELLRPRAHK